MIESISTRTTKGTLNFRSDFRIGKDDELFPAGPYEILTTEAVHEGNERTVYRRISTVLIVNEVGKTRYCEVAPSDLDDAVRRDEMT
jgi:hypothetical protein